jgi:hypothetical protein
MAAPAQRGGSSPPSGPSKLLLVLGLAGLGVGGYALYYALGRSYLDEEALLHGSLIGGVGLVFFCLWLRKAVNPALASVVLAGAIGTVGYFAMGALDQQQVRMEESLVEDQFFALISPVCSDNRPLPDARGYVAGGANTAIFFTQQSSGRVDPSRYGVTEEFRAGSVDELALVVCTAIEAQSIEVCPYNAGDRMLSRQRYVRTVRVVDPTTATLLDTLRLEGTMPAECPASRTFGEYESSANNFGSRPSDIDVIDGIRDWLDGTATAGATGSVVAPGNGSIAAPGTGTSATPPTGGSNVGTPVPGVKPGDEEPPPSGKP